MRDDISCLMYMERPSVVRFRDSPSGAQEVVSELSAAAGRRMATPQVRVREVRTRASVGSVTTPPLMVIDVETDRGVTGHSYPFPIWTRFRRSHGGRSKSFTPAWSDSGGTAGAPVSRSGFPALTACSGFVFRG